MLAPCLPTVLARPNRRLKRRAEATAGQSAQLPTSHRPSQYQLKMLRFLSFYDCLLGDYYVMLRTHDQRLQKILNTVAQPVQKILIFPAHNQRRPAMTYHSIGHRPSTLSLKWAEDGQALPSLDCRSPPPFPSYYPSRVSEGWSCSGTVVYMCVTSVCVCVCVFVCLFVCLFFLGGSFFPRALSTSTCSFY